MKQKLFKQIISGLLAFLLALSLAGCGEQDNEESVPEVEEPLYPVSINGTEIRVGETTIQALLDAGYEIAWSEMIPGTPPQINEYTLDPETKLERNSYYSGAHVNVGDHISVLISFATDRAAVPLFWQEDDSEHPDILFNGVPVTELTREMAGEMFPDFKGDSAMWFSSGLKNYEYFLGFDSNTGEMRSFSVEREYDVDWNSN